MRGSRILKIFRMSHGKGFGLLELLIAMSVLAVGTLGIVKLQMQSGFGNVGSRNQSAAVNLARSKMEELKRVASYSLQLGTIPSLVDPESANPASTIDLGDWASPDYSEGPFNESQDWADSRGRIFTRSWNVVDHYPLANFKTVRVRVNWDEGGRSRNLDVESQIGLKDLAYFE